MKVPNSASALRIEQRDDVAVVTLARSEKRNALNEAMIQALHRFFEEPPAWTKAVVLDADGDHFSAGLDLTDLGPLDAVAGMHHSRRWHRAFAHIESGTVPVVAVLKGAVVGGGLELATAAHLRVAEDSTFFALPEGSRGLFVGGGASVRVPRLMGVHRMTDMMLTGRVLTADEGASAGLVDYRVPDGAGLDRALELAGRIAANSEITNYAVLQALPRISEAAPETGLLMESMMAAIAQSSSEAKERMSEFLSGRAPKVAAARDER